MGEDQRWYYIFETTVDYLGRFTKAENAWACARVRFDSTDGVISERDLHKLILNAWKALEIK